MIVLRNPGHTPATQTNISGEGFPIGPVNPTETARICREAGYAIEGGTAIGPNVFPGDQKILDYTFNLPKDRIEAYWSRFLAVKPALHPMLAVCVAYVEHGGGHQIHHTPFILEIMSRTKAISPIDMPIPITELRVRTSPFGAPPPD
jgi:hypothetical protein